MKLISWIKTLAMLGSGLLSAALFVLYGSFPQERALVFFASLFIAVPVSQAMVYYIKGGE